MRRSSLLLAVLGVLFIAAAGVVRFAIVPGATDLPSDLDFTAHYSGKGTLLNVSALTSGDLANALASNIDVTSDQRVYVSRTDGSTAVVHVDSTMNAGPTKLTESHVYAIDRDTRAQAAAPAGETVEPHTDLTITLPLDPKADNSHKFYDPATRASGTLTYAGAEAKGGRDTYHYTAEFSGEVKNEQLTASLPPALPKSLAVTLLPLLPADVQAKLVPLAASLPDLIPLSYTVKSTYGLWADTDLGAPLDSSLKQTIVASASLGGQSLELLPVFDINLTQTQASVQELADEADSAATRLSLVGTWLPIGLLAIGVILIVVAILRRRPVAAAATEPADS